MQRCSLNEHNHAVYNTNSICITDIIHCRCSSYSKTKIKQVKDRQTSRQSSRQSVRQTYKEICRVASLRKMNRSYHFIPIKPFIFFANSRLETRCDFVWVLDQLQCQVNFASIAAVLGDVNSRLPEIQVLLRY